ncbi:hypothetical protein FV222_01555 [Methylobacterium sp. WL103]|uniref:sigma factor n=1 Tax=Methylobacterium sp. WL103 TaxID=2603891 RepID=UPI0011CB4038|nr:sigma factor [Methylobacterium sp. WL103]TXN07948.1 hypothetical protein FV222_01555 [Methylobacterium sp. WL103]
MRFEDSETQIKKAAPRYLRRAHAAGAVSVTLEDVIAELNLAWVIASQKFNPNLGVPFAAYLARGMMNHANRFIDEQIGHSINAYSLDEGGSDDEGSERHEWLVADMGQRQDEALEDKQMYERAMSELSVPAAQFVELLLNPPPALYEELDAINARTAHARSRGIATQSPKTITGNLVLDLMGVERAERNRIYAEVKALGVTLQSEITQQ